MRESESESKRDTKEKQMSKYVCVSVCCVSKKERK